MRNNVFKSKETRNEVLRKIFRGFEERKKGTINILKTKRQHEK